MSENTTLCLKARTVADMMTPDPVHIFDGSSLEDAARSLSERAFSAMPVLDADGQVVGVVSHTDIVRAIAEHRTGISLPLDSNADGEEPDRLEGTFDTQSSGSPRVRDIMTHACYSVRPTAPVTAAIDAMAEQGVRRVFVVDEHNMLVGVVSAIDVIELLAPPQRT